MDMIAFLLLLGMFLRWKLVNSFKECKKMENIMEQVFQGNVVVNLKKTLIMRVFHWGFADVQ